MDIEDGVSRMGVHKIVATTIMYKEDDAYTSCADLFSSSNVTLIV